MPTYTTIFRTSAWDEGISEIAARARACCTTGNFVVAADETKGRMSVEPYSKLSHDDDFSTLALPRIPRDRVLWWNADFVLYYVREKMEKTDYYVMLESDVLIDCDLDSIVERCTRDHVDLIAHELKPLSETHWSRPSLRDITQEPWCALIPFAIVSGRAADVLLRTRQAMAVGMRDGWIRYWPYFESFIPTVIAHQGNMVMSDLANYVDTKLLRSEPVLDLRDPQLRTHGIVAHPVASGARFVKALLVSEPFGQRAGYVDRARRQDQTEFEEEFLDSSFGDDTPIEPSHPYRLRHFRMGASLEDGNGVASLAVVLGEQASSDLFVKAVTAVIYEKVFGLEERGGYNVDSLAGLTAAIDSSQYVLDKMSKAKRFANGNLLRDFAVVNAPPSGMILEFGVFSGHTINRFAAQFPDRRVYGFDSFEGLPEDWIGPWNKGVFRRTRLPEVRENVDLVVGWFDQTLQRFLEEHPDDPVALLHIDCDLYSSTKTVFSLLSNRIVSGTIVVFDEYLNHPGWRAHEYKAFQEFVALRNVAYEYIGLVPNGGQVLLRIVGVG